MASDNTLHRRRVIETDASRFRVVALLKHVREHFQRPGRKRQRLEIVRFWEVKEADGTRELWLALSSGYSLRATLLPTEADVIEVPIEETADALWAAARRDLFADGAPSR